MSEASANGQDTAWQESAQDSGHRMPAVHASGLHVPGMHVPSGTAGDVLWWGGLAAVAAFGVVDWPVAGLVAAGTRVAGQHAKAAQRPGEMPAAVSERAA